MERRFEVTRRVDKSEQPWMSDDEIVEAGTVVWSYVGCTYGCIGAGRAVTMERGKTPFFELPANALREIPK